MKIYYLLIFTLLFSCGNESTEEIGYVGSDMEFEELLEVPATMQPPSQNNSIDTGEVTKKVVKTGGIDFQSDNIEEDYRRIREILPDFNAYMENENQSKTNQRVNYSLTIRVPASEYDTLYSSISILAFKLDNRYSNIEDVTERYFDLKTRIKNKEILEKRYLELLSKAVEIKDILEIEKHLNLVRTDIEQLQGQFNYLSKQVRYSTIHLNFYEVLPYSNSHGEGFGARLLHALETGWQGFLSFLVFSTSIWPFAILLIVFGFLFRKWRKNKK